MRIKRFINGRRKSVRLPSHPRSYSDDIPASGAWSIEQGVGNRNFVEVVDGQAFVLESGETLDYISMAYETWGELSPEGDNAILVCHALTGDSHAYGDVEPSHSTPGWWNGLIGPGCALDTEKNFIVCINVLGGCQGSTGPASINPKTGKQFGPDFPVITIRDIVRCQRRVADHLGVEKWSCVVGGSMGGMQVLEWGVMFPDRVSSLAPLATTLRASAQQIAWSAIGRTALSLDPRFRGANYYEAEPGDGPTAGIAIARSVAQTTYRSEGVYSDRFGRDLVDPRSIYGLWDRFQVESYLDYHGEKLARRFDANSYLILNRAMDLHDIARDRGSLKGALERIARVPVMTLSISSDALYPSYQQKELREAVVEAGGDCEYHMVDSPDGHDAFLLAVKEIGVHLESFLSKVSAG